MAQATKNKAGSAAEERPGGPAQKPKPKRFHPGRRLVLMVTAAFFSTLFFIGALSLPRANGVQAQVLASSASLLGTTANNLTGALNGTTEAVQLDDRLYAEKAAALAVYLEALPEGQEPELPALVSQVGGYDLYLTDGVGKVLRSAGHTLRLTDPNASLLDLLRGGTPFTDGDYRYYPADYKGGYLLLVCAQAAVNGAVDPNEIVREGVGATAFDTGTFVFCVDRESGTLLSQRKEVDGLALDKTGLDVSELESGKKDFYEVGRGYYYYCVGQDLSPRYYLVAATDMASSLGQVLYGVSMPLLAFVLVLLAIQIFAGILLYDRRLNRDDRLYHRFLPGVWIDRPRLVKLLPIALVGLLLLGGASYYMQTLNTLANQGYKSIQDLEELTAQLEENDQKSQKLDTDFDRGCVEQARLAAWMIDANPALLTDAGMQALAAAFGAEEIYVFNGVGRTEATSTAYKNYSLSTEPTDPSYGFWSILKGDRNDLVSHIPDGALDGAAAAQDGLFVTWNDKRSSCFAGTRRLDTPGVVRLTYSTADLDAAMDRLGLQPTLDAQDPGANGGLLVADENGRVVYWDKQILAQPMDSAAVGVQASALRNNYLGKQVVYDAGYYLVTRQYGALFLSSATKYSYLMQGRLSTAMRAVQGGFWTLLLQVLLAVLHFGRNPIPDKPRDEPARPASSWENYHTQWNQSAVPWRDKTAEQRFAKILSILGAAGVLLTALNALVWSSSPESQALLSILRGQWLRGLNIFSVSAVLLIFSLVVVVSWLARLLLLQVGRSLGPRSETVCRLLGSAVKYLAIIGAAFYCLNYIGIETKTLLASAGVLTVVIGIGAQSMVGDLLAGISIVFEGEYRVGDVITIGDWMGTVQEIGLRATKVKDRNNNIKIINNATITQVVNMTQEYSYAECDVQIEYGESLERVEEVLAQEFPGIRERLPKILAGPLYMGVLSLEASGVVLGIQAQCYEQDRIPLVRMLNREIKLVFDRNGISIAFPQMVLHTPAGDPPARTVTEEESRQARRFVETESQISGQMLRNPGASQKIFREGISRAAAEERAKTRQEADPPQGDAPQAASPAAPFPGSPAPKEKN